MKQSKKRANIILPLWGKMLLVLLFLFGIAACWLSGVGAFFCIQEGIYTSSLPDAQRQTLRQLCEEDTYRVYDGVFLPLLDSGALTEERSEFERSKLYEEYLSAYDEEKSNFFFQVQSEDGTVLLQSYEATAQYKITRSFIRETTQNRTLIMSQEDYEAFSPAPNQTIIGVCERQEATAPAASEKTYYEVVLQERTSAGTFYVTGFVRDELKAEDRYMQRLTLCETLYQYRYLPAVICVLSLILIGTALILLLESAGYRKGQEGAVCRIPDRIPFEMYTLLLGVGIMILLVLCDELSNVYNMEEILIFFAILLPSIGLLLLLWLMSLVVRIRTKSFCQHTLVFLFLQFLKKLKRKAEKALVLLPVLGQSILAAAVYFLLQFIAVCMIGNGDMMGVFLMILLWILGLLIVGVVIWNLHILERAGRQLAKGELQYQIPEGSLIGPFRKHAQKLNQLREGMNKAVSERMKSELFKTELIANVSHDIRTPLTSIINYTDLLAKLELKDEEAVSYIAVLQRQSARLQKLTEDVLEASKASTGNLTVQAEKMDLRVLLEQILGEYTEKLEERQLHIVSDIPAEPLFLMADGRLFWRVMDNLLTNICKYAMPHTRVYLDVISEEKELHLVLRNISRTQLHISADALMERFVQGDRSRNTEGSGLGLSIAQSLTELQGGRFEIQIDGDLFKVQLIFPKI